MSLMHWHISEQWGDVIGTYKLVALNVHPSHVWTTLFLASFLNPGLATSILHVSVSWDHIAQLHSVYHMSEAGIFNQTIWPQIRGI